MHLLRCLVFLKARYQCFMFPTFINTRANHLADDLSRNNAASFLSKVPGAPSTIIGVAPTPPPTAGPPSGLDLSALAPAVQQYFQAGLAPSTQRSYQAAMKRFYNFCTSLNVTDPFPLTEQTLCFFAVYLAEQGLAPQTGKAYLSALRNTQISLGLPDPREQSSLPLLKRIQAGISRIRLQRGNTTPKRIRLPITIHTLEKMREALFTSDEPNRVVLWAVASVAFFGFFRLGELLPDSAGLFNPSTSLAWGDVSMDNQAAPRMIQVHLKRSKCDQFGAGSDVVVGVTGTATRPVTAMVRYLEIRGSQAGPFFLDTSGRIVTKPWFVGRVRDILATIGIPAHQYAGHSFRIGAATTAALAGVKDSMIQTLGRWHSAAFLRYIRTPKERLAALSVNLAGSGSREFQPQ